MSKHQPLTVCLQETKLIGPPSFHSNLYNISHTNSPNGTAQGGVALIHRKDLNAESINLTTNLQATAIKFKIIDNITVCSIYLPPNTDISRQDITNLLNELPKPFILTGDLNAHSPLWGNNTYNAKGRIIEDIITNNSNYSILNNGSPTYYNIDTGWTSAIDLSICTSSLLSSLTWSVDSNLYNSDHFPTLTHLSSLNKRTKLTKQKFKEDIADWELYAREVDLTNISISDDIDLSSKLITDEIYRAASCTIPKTSNNIKHPPVPWWNPAIKKFIKNKRKLFRIFKFSPTVDNLINYKKARALVRLNVKKSKQETWQKFVAEINPQTPPKKYWNNIKKIQGKNTHLTTIGIRSDNKILTDSQQIADKLAATFANNSSNISLSHYDLNKKQQITCQLNVHSFVSSNGYKYNTPISMAELNGALDNVKGSSPGPDGITYKMLKNLKEESKIAILKLYNIIWHLQKIPQQWLRSNIIAIGKPKKDLMEPHNYRPISLTNCICKVFERIINRRLVWHLESENFFTKFQAGFRANRSTIDQTVFLTQHIEEAFKHGNDTFAIFFDLEKAYEKIWTSAIIKTLIENNIHGNLLAFINNFVNNRMFSVQYNGFKSSFYTQENGIPQGSVLSVSLFLIGINNINHYIGNDTKFLLYADDLVIFMSGNDTHKIKNTLQHTINKLKMWSQSVGLKFSEAKTKMMHFSRKYNKTPCPTIMLYNQPIDQVHEYKFLGLIFDEKLSWHKHIYTIKSDSLKRLNIIKMLAHTSWGAHRKSLLNIYRALVVTKIEYGSVCYGSASLSILKSLNTIHNSGIRFSIGAYCTSPIESILCEAGIPSLSNIREKTFAKYIINLLARKWSPTFQCLESHSTYPVLNYHQRQFSSRAKYTINITSPIT